MRSRNRARIAAAASLGAILIGTLWPFAFEPYSPAWSELVGAFGLAPRTVLDFPRNVLLFTPLGTALASLVGQRDRSRRMTVLLVGLTGLAVSLSVELLQIFLPGRTSNISDIFGNTLGAAAAGYGYLWWRRQASSGAPVPRLAPGVSAAAFGLYFALMLLLTWALMWGARPQRWEARYPLALGAEFTHQKPWAGSVRDLLVLDRAVDDDAAARLLNGERPPGLDQAVVAESVPDPCTGVASELHFDCAHGHAVSIVARETGRGSPADRINRSRQFTVALTAQTAHLIQQDVAPIVTSSPNPFEGNLAFGQDDMRLVLRWRSPLTLANDMTPELEFPGVFTTLDPQRLVISFDGSHASVRTPAMSTVFFVGPEALFSAMLREVNVWPLTPQFWQWWVLAAPLPALMFVPLGVLLGQTIGMARRRAVQVAVVAAGVLLPVLLMEAFVAWYGTNAMRIEVVTLGVALALTGFVAHMVGSAYRFRPWRSRRSSPSPSPSPPCLPRPSRSHVMGRT